MPGSSSGCFSTVLSWLFDAFVSCLYSGPAPKQRRVVEGRVPTATAADMAELSRRTGGVGSHASEIPVGEPIVPPYNGSKVLPFARLLHEDRTTGASARVDEEPSDSLLEELMASPPPFEYYHGEQLEDDPQLTAGNMKKFQVVVREFTRFSVVSTIVENFFPFVEFFCRLSVLLQQMANQSYLKSQKLKETEVDRQKIALLEAVNAAF